MFCCVFQRIGPLCTCRAVEFTFSLHMCRGRFDQVLTGQKPWEGHALEDVSAKVSSGARPELVPLEGITFEGYEHFGDLVRTLWAQDPKARPALGDVARGLRVPEPRSAPAIVAGSSVVVDDVEADVEGVSAEGEVETTEHVEQAFTASKEGCEGVDKGDEMDKEEGETWTDAGEGSGGVSVLASAEGGTPWVVGDEASCPGSHGASGGSATPVGSGGGGETLLAASNTPLPLDLLGASGSEGKLTTPLKQQSSAGCIESLNDGDDGVVKDAGAAATAAANRGGGGEPSATVESGADFLRMAAAMGALKENKISAEPQPAGMGERTSAHTSRVESERETASKVDSDIDGDANAFGDSDDSDYADAMSSLPWVAPENSTAACALGGKQYTAMTPPRERDDRQAACTTAVDVPVARPASSVSSQHSSPDVALRSPEYTPRDRRGYPNPLLSASPIGSSDSGPPSSLEPDWDGRGDDGNPDRASTWRSRGNGTRAGILMRPVTANSAAARSAEHTASEFPGGAETKFEVEDQIHNSVRPQDPRVDAGATVGQTIVHRETAPAYTVAPGVENGTVRSGRLEAAAIAAALAAVVPSTAGEYSEAATSSKPPAQTVPVAIRDSRQQSSPKDEPQLADLSSPDPSQLSTTSRGGATVVLTPLPAAAPPAAVLKMKAAVVVSPSRPPRSTSVPARASSAHVKDGAMGVTSGGGGAIAGEVAGDASMSSRTPSKSGAGTKLRGITSSLAWFRRRRSRGGVEAFSLQEI